MITWSPGTTIASAEREVIQQAYKFYRGNKTATANALDISVRTLDNKLEQYANDERIAANRAAERAANRTGLLSEQRGGKREAHTGRPVENYSSSSSGVFMEPTPAIGAEPSMSMPERSQVQEVLSAEVAGRRPGRPRKTI